MEEEKKKLEKGTLGEPRVKTSENKKEKAVVVPLRGRKFEGYVIRKFEGRVTIEFERVKPLRKYERYIKTKTKMHARLPKALINDINIGDYVQVQECRPLSKILHHIVVKKIRGGKEE
jgi:small subunit ribosomal protein S17